MVVYYIVYIMHIYGNIYLCVLYIRYIVRNVCIFLCTTFAAIYILHIYTYIYIYIYTTHTSGVSFIAKLHNCAFINSNHHPLQSPAYNPCQCHQYDTLTGGDQSAHIIISRTGAAI